MTLPNGVIIALSNFFKNAYKNVVLLHCQFHGSREKEKGKKKKNMYVIGARGMRESHS